jgi:hypothetical protein
MADGLFRQNDAEGISDFADLEFEHGGCAPLL